MFLNALVLILKLTSFYFTSSSVFTNILTVYRSQTPALLASLLSGDFTELHTKIVSDKCMSESQSWYFKVLPYHSINRIISYPYNNILYGRITFHYATSRTALFAAFVADRFNPPPKPCKQVSPHTAFHVTITHLYAISFSCVVQKM